MEFLVGSGLALVALGIALMLGVPPPGWPKMPHWLIRFAISAGMVCFVIGLALIGIGGCHDSEIGFCRGTLDFWARIKAGALPTIVIVILGAGTAFAMFGGRQSEQRIRARIPTLTTIGPWLLIVGGPVLGLLWLYWESGTPRALPGQANDQVFGKREHQTGTVIDEATKPTIPSGIELDFSTGSLPRIAPPDGTLHLIEISERSSGMEAFPSEHQFAPNEIIVWQQRFPEWPIFGISKCEITSTTNESVFEAVIPIDLSFREMIPDSPNLPPVEVGGMLQAFSGGIQMRSGRVVKTQSTKIRVGRIYPQTPYVIYFVNRTKYLVDIAIPPDGKVLDFSKTGNEFEKQLNIKFGRTGGMHLPTSIVPTNVPPTPPPSTPEER